jgi:hypothetical protein
VSSPLCSAHHQRFEQLLLGRHYSELPFLASRVSGSDSLPHTLAALQAIEQAFSLPVTIRTEALRELMLQASYLQSHASHLYFQIVASALGSNDSVGVANFLTLAQSHPDAFANAVTLRQLGSELLRVVGGRAIHPITATIAGFSREPRPAELLATAERLDAALDAALATTELIHSLVPATASRSTVDEDAAPTAVFAAAAASAAVPASFTPTALEATSAPATAEPGAAPVPAALDRVNSSWDRLSQHSKLAAAKIGLRPVEHNHHRNPEAEAVELVEAVVRCAALCRELAAEPPAPVAAAPVASPNQPAPPSSTPLPSIPARATEGIGIVAAAKGTLSHHYRFDAQGFVTSAKIDDTPRSR